MPYAKKDDTQKNKDSFLNEFQLEGKGSGKIALEDWEDAMGSVNKIITVYKFGYPT